MDHAQHRAQMVEEQLVARGIRDPRVLAAMRRVPREVFVPAERAAQAYADGALPVDCGQTISQPYMVALMSEALQLAGHERVLEIGTGTGYQTAVLSELAAEVVTIERHAHLSAQAQARLAAQGRHNVQCLAGDGTLGHAPRAPYHGILVTAAAAEVPPALWQQLAEGGRLVMPLGEPGAGQTLVVILRQHDRPQVTQLVECRFVPLVAGPAR